MKRVLCILSALTTGGAETFLMKIYRALPPSEYQFDFIVSEDNGYYTQEVINRGGKIYLIPKRTEHFLLSMCAIVRTVCIHRYRYVLKLGNPPIAGLDLIAARLGGAKVLAMRSCNALTGLSWRSRVIDILMRPILNLAANVKIAPSMLAAEYTFGKRVAHKKVHLLHNGVDLSFYQYTKEGCRRIKEEFSLDGKLVVGHVGRFHKQKNHQFLLEVFKNIKSLRSDAVLMLVGVGELEFEIRNQIENMNLGDSVILTGLRFDIPDLLSAMDVFVFPSFHEGMPNAVIEAQATGLPCVVADAITREADITGLVEYLSLEQSPRCWAETAIAAVVSQKNDTKQAFRDNGYDIYGVAQELLSLLGC